jgi:hypothetical protein
MANPEHLKILKQGVKAWNKWREENPSIRPDLSEANLSWANLSGAQLDNVDLHQANLRVANLVMANLNSSNLTEVNLSGADISKVNLSYANLSEADLSYADLSKADLSYVDLSGANLTGAVLPRTKLVSATLMRANLNMAKIQVALLSDSNLKNANLKHANLRHSNLVKSDLSCAILTGAKLYGTARDGWIIKDIECKYVYWDEHGERRSPKDRDLDPGEFERLYAALPTIEYIFENGMSPIDLLIMDRVVQAIREKKPELDIKIDSINARGLAPSIRFTVRNEEHKEPALEQVQKEYEIKLKQLESERDRYYQLLARALDAPKEVKLISAGPGAIVATDGSTINIQQHIHNALELQKVIADEPEDSKSFAKVAKKTALDIIGGTIKDIAKGQVKEAAKQIVELGKDLGSLFIKMAPEAYAFFKSLYA